MTSNNPEPELRREICDACKNEAEAGGVFCSLVGIDDAHKLVYDVSRAFLCHNCKTYWIRKTQETN